MSVKLCECPKTVIRHRIGALYKFMYGGKEQIAIGTYPYHFQSLSETDKYWTYPSIESCEVALRSFGAIQLPPGTCVEYKSEV